MTSANFTKTTNAEKTLPASTSPDHSIVSVNEVSVKLEKVVKTLMNALYRHQMRAKTEFVETQSAIITVNVTPVMNYHQTGITV